MQDTISTDVKQDEGADSTIKTRLANLLINRVALSECLNVIRDACVQRAAEVIENADEEQINKILQDLESFENPPQENEPEDPSGSQPPPSAEPELTPC
tara:strand:- start:6287 stop:6583 length:297 start_codon:yes stop_codon:yes gene_type:complete